MIDEIISYNIIYNNTYYSSVHKHAQYIFMMCMALATYITYICIFNIYIVYLYYKTCANIKTYHVIYQFANN
jgi:hypothetical protein